MKEWRKKILADLTSRESNPIVVCDPDALLLDERLLGELAKVGIELVQFDDPITFRFAYSRISQAETGQDRAKPHRIIVRECMDNPNTVPYDLLRAGAVVSVGLGELFPSLSYPVIKAVRPVDLDTLYNAQPEVGAQVLGDAATKDFVLLHVYNIVPDLLTGPVDILRMLLRLHYGGGSLPTIFQERLLDRLRRSGRFEAWPLDEIVSDREAFFEFLQERWPAYVERLLVEHGVIVSENRVSYSLRRGGPENLPFEHDDIRVYIDSLFLEGMLRPVSYEYASHLSATWAAVGLRVDHETDDLRRAQGLIEAIGSSLPPRDAHHTIWSDLARRWAELLVAASGLGVDSGRRLRSDLEDLQGRVDHLFLDWVWQRYGLLHNQPPDPPAMVHHIGRCLAHRLGEPGFQRIALIVIDGLAYDQWAVARNAIRSLDPHLSFDEGAVFAWIPTLTNISRQAIFAGRPPMYFPGSIESLANEVNLWTQLWADEGLRQSEVAFEKMVGDEDLGKTVENLSNPAVRVAGLVVAKVDKIMHGMELGTAGMHNQVKQWIEQGVLLDLLNALFEAGYAVFITSDHGSIEAVGCGQPAEGAIAESRGERARIYRSTVLRDRVKAEYPEAIEWLNVGLPDGFIPLLAPDRLAFKKEGTRTVAHGGISLEEVVVPFVHVESRR